MASYFCHLMNVFTFCSECPRMRVLACDLGHVKSRLRLGAAKQREQWHSSARPVFCRIPESSCGRWDPGTGSVGERRQVRTLPADGRDSDSLGTGPFHQLKRSEVGEVGGWEATGSEDGRTGNGPVCRSRWFTQVVASGREARPDPTALAGHLDGCQCRVPPTLPTRGPANET